MASVQTPRLALGEKVSSRDGNRLITPRAVVVWWTRAQALPCYAQSGESLRDLDEAPWSNVDGRRPSEGRLGTYDELLAGLASARRPAVDNRCCILTRHPCAKGLATLRAARKRVGPMLAVEFPWPSDRGESRIPPLRLRWGLKVGGNSNPRKGCNLCRQQTLPIPRVNPGARGRSESAKCFTSEIFPAGVLQPLDATQPSPIFVSNIPASPGSRGGQYPY